ncbi:MAG TPA: GDP-mannose 4,6-dehydratase [Candidatus Acidoferrales bacterium]|nr:GDP-mannose 4,6-dehydratase [Candidatus Acidoferrales bacterium]
MRALVTGGNGFVGKHLGEALRARGYTVICAGRSADGSDVDFPLDLLDFDNVRGVVEAARADVVLHLAAQAFVPAATRDPLETYQTNILGTARLYEALRQSGQKPRLLFVSSAEVYGAREPSAYPLRESAAVRPMTPYAASKAAGEAIALASERTYAIPSIVARAFNHIGPGQDERYAIPSFALQLAAIAAGAPAVLRVGNLQAERDFLDVRDVVQAYIDLIERAQAGETYNVCSGRAVSLQEMLRRLIAIAHVAVEVRDDPERLRPSDTPLSYGDATKLQSATGWKPMRTLDESLRDVYADARERLLAGVQAPAS